MNCLGLVDALNGDGIPQTPEELLMAQREDVVVSWGALKGGVCLTFRSHIGWMLPPIGLQPVSPSGWGMV